MKACKYCGSRCEDSRGNCGACGAPKGEFEDDPPILVKTELCYGTPITVGELGREIVLFYEKKADDKVRTKIDVTVGGHLTPKMRRELAGGE